MSLRGVVLSQSGLGAQSTGVLENTLWTGVVDELIPPDQPFLHQNLAPGAEAVG